MKLEFENCSRHLIMNTVGATLNQYIIFPILPMLRNNGQISIVCRGGSLRPSAAILQYRINLYRFRR